MALETQVTKIRYDGDDLETTFPYPFIIYNGTELVVELLSGSWSVLSEGFDYELTDVGEDEGGNVEKTTPLMVGEQLLIYRAKPYKQETQFEEGESFHAVTAEQTYDKNVILSQQLKEISDRSLKIPIEDELTLSEFPLAAVRANKYPAFDADGDITIASASDIIGTADHGALAGLTDDDHTQYILVNGTRAFTGVVGGITPTANTHLTTKLYVDAEIINALDYTDESAQDAVGNIMSGLGTVNVIYDDVVNTITISGSGIIDHGLLLGLTDDDHAQYILVDGTRPFTGTVSGVAPTEDAHLTTKFYVDETIATATGALTTIHSELVGLGADDHLQYILVDGTRGFTSTVSGVTPAELYHLATKGYIDDEIGSLSVVTSAINGQYQLTNGSNLATIPFSPIFPDTNYTVTANVKNTVDVNPSIFDFVITDTTASGFSIELGGTIDSTNYYLEYTAITNSGALIAGSHIHVASNIINFNEAAQDTVGSIMSGDGTVTVTYDDAAGTITISGSGIVDHGLLTGLSDDDHTQYSLSNGTRNYTGIVSYNAAKTFTNNAQIVDKKYVDDAIVAATGTLTTDHGNLVGLGDDDHTQYHTNGRGDARYSLLGHGHTESDISDLGSYIENVADDSSPELGGNLVLGSYNVDYGSILTVNGTYRGEIMTVTVDDASAVFGHVLCQGADFHYDRADASSSTTVPGFVIALESGAGSKKVLLRGQVCNTAWAWAAGKLWVNTTAGGMIQTVPSTSGDQIQPVGWALSADTIFFSGSITHGEAA